jgi:hypothetical protein
MAKVEWRAGDEDIGLLVLEDHSAGQEISNNYGPRNNEQCTYPVSHGMVLNLCIPRLTIT